MATLQQYYLEDFSSLLNVHSDWALYGKKTGATSVAVNVHLDFDSNTFFISYYIPRVDSAISVFNLLLSRLEDAKKVKDGIEIKTKLPGEMEITLADLVFSGRVFFYYEGIVDETEFFNFRSVFEKEGIFPHFRDIRYAIEKSKFEMPLAFISHDSRDKETIARPIALELKKRLVPIWYDEYSLKLGDSLREKIEQGLKECKRCILILSPNFLTNSGWSKTEFNMVFTREVIETQKLVLPIWAGVTKEEVYEYSAILGDRVGVKWENGLDFVVNKIQQVLVVK